MSIDLRKETYSKTVDRLLMNAIVADVNLPKKFIRIPNSTEKTKSCRTYPKALYIEAKKYIADHAAEGYDPDMIEDEGIYTYPSRYNTTPEERAAIIEINNETQEKFAENYRKVIMDDDDITSYMIYKAFWYNYVDALVHYREYAAEKDERIKRLEEKNKQLTWTAREIDRLNIYLKESNCSNTAEELIDDNRKLRSENTTLKENIKDDGTELINENTTLKENIKDLNRQITSLKKANDSLKKENEGLKARNKRLEEKIKYLLEENDNLFNFIRNIRISIDAVSSSIRESQDILNKNRSSVGL